MTATEIESGKAAVMIELKTRGYSEQEIGTFQKTRKCSRCGCDFSALTYGLRWLSHLSNCNGKHKQAV